MIKETTLAVFFKNRYFNQKSKLSFAIQQLFDSLFDVGFAFFIYKYIFSSSVSDNFKEATGSTNYLQFIVVGSSMYVMTSATLLSISRSLIIEVRQGTIESFLLSPVSKIGYYFGTFLEQFIRSCLELVSVVFMGFIFGYHASITSILLMAFMAIIVSISCFGLAIVISVIMVYCNDTFITQNTILMIISIVSGAYFPTQYLPKALQIIGNFLPVTWGIRIARRVTSDLSLTTIRSTDVAWLLLLSILYTLAGLKFLKILEPRIIDNAFS